MVERVVDSDVEKVSNCLSNPLGYLCKYNRNFENLKNEVDNLINAKEYVQHRVDDAKRKGEVIEKMVEKWLSSVDESIDEAGKIVKDEEDLKYLSSKGLCSDVVTRYQLSKKAKRELKAIVGLREEGKFDKVSFRTTPQYMWLASTKGYEAFETRMSSLNDIFKALSNPNVNMIGVYGMGGIGKTELVKEVARQAKKDKLIDEVVFAEVSQTPVIKKIQGEIADKLFLEFFVESESGRARMLCERLRKEKKILIILDNIWTSLDLEAVGIPIGDDDGVFKVLLTARNLDVLASKMGCQNNYLVGVLNEEEAWRLFKRMAGDRAENYELQSLAIDMAKSCGGLPVAIVTIAKALRDKSVFAWKNALQNLRSTSSRNFAGMQAVFHSTIELSYNHLEGEELKSTFLLCSLITYSCNVPIMDLLKYGKGLGLFSGINTLEETRMRVYTLVHELKNSCLLLDGHTSEWFSMHDVVRHVAASIASRDQHVFTLRNEIVPRDWPDSDALKSCTAISIHDSNITEIPEKLEYPILKFFYMNVKDPFFKIPDNFFTKMPQLRVLKLTRMHLLTLPWSFYHLVNLRTLHLDHCVLGNISIIGELKKLEILSIACCDIELLPAEIGQLTRLKLLDLSNCSKLKVISANVIASLSQLEELYMGNSIVKWEFEGHHFERSNASLQELKYLSQLTTLEIHIQDPKILPKGLFLEKLTRYKIFIGDEWDWSDKHEYKRTLKLKLSNNICPKYEIILQLKGIEGLYLDEVPGVKNVLYELDGEGFPQLRHLNVQNSPHFLCIVNSVKSVPCDAFPVLESLFLRNLINLEKICYGQLTSASFCKLRILNVRNCDKLKNIFSISIVKDLQQLQKAEVIKCKNIEEIFTVGKDNDVNYTEVIDKIEFGQLRSLTLKFLPQLTSFYSNVKTNNTWSNEIILEDEVSMPIFNDKVVLPNLETLELHAINSDRIWRNQLAVLPCIQSLTRLIVRGCNKLKYLFSSSMAINFVQLQHLEISHCPVLEDIIAKEGRTEAAVRFVFPQVTFLKLWNLSELRSFYPEIHTSDWPLLKRLEVSGCDKVTIFTSEFLSFEEIREGQLNTPVQHALFLVEKVVPNLEELKLSGKYLSKIWSSQFTEFLFDKLKILEVMNDNSTNFPLGFLQRFCNLEKLEFRWCSYTEMFSFGDVRKYVGMLAQIKTLKLWELSSLKYIWQEYSELESVLQNLEILEVWWCDNLINLLPSSATLQNLTSLELWNCKGLENSLAPSTAKSLVRLTKMSIDGCEMMTEIIASKGDVAEDDIIFSKLKWLSLECLESLTSFCSGNYAFKFPSLEDLFVIECPKMKIFSQGVLTAPRLQEVRQNWGPDKGRWEGDLNTTIQQLHNEKICDDPASKACQEESRERKQSTKGEGLKCYVKLKLSLPSLDEVSTRFLARSSRVAHGGLLVNRDGYQIVYQRESEAPPPIKPFDNQLNLGDLDTIRVVGEGKGSIVQLVQHKWTRQFFALKVFKGNAQESAWKQIAQRLRIIQSSHCPQVVVFYQQFYKKGAISIILEYMDGGSLADFLKKVKMIPEVYLAAICKQVLKGLSYLHHEKHIIHRDLKPSNFLINHQGQVKITDFGLSTILADTTGVTDTFIGAYNYMSPERIQGIKYGNKSDIWSLGLVILECAIGQFPYSPPEQEGGLSSMYELMEAIVDQPPPRASPDQFSAEFCSFIFACLQKEPRDRQPARKLLTHPFLHLYDNVDVDLSAYFTGVGSPLATI